MEEPPNPVVGLAEHPLQNQVILRILFDIMESSASAKLDDWKNYRLVCKLWHSENLSRWRSNAVLDLDDETPLFRQKSLAGFKKLTASDLLLLWQNPNDPYKLKEKPYLNFKLQDQTINLPVCDSSLTASLFWSTVGPWMKSLILTKVNFESSNDREGTSELLNFLIAKTPNLEQVTFDTLFWDGMEMDRAGLAEDGWSYSRRDDLMESLWCTSVVSLACTDCFVFPFYCFPNLQKVRLQLVECNEGMGFLELLESLFFDDPSTIPAEHNPVQYSKVTHLDIMSCFLEESESRQSFQNIKFPFLEHLSFNLNYLSDSDDQRFNEFEHSMIANHRETLKVLEVFCWVPFRFGDWAIEYPMPVLSKLFLWGNCMENLDFLRFTPNLTFLHIDLYGLEKQEEMKDLLLEGPDQIVSRRDYLPERDIVEASRLSGNLAGVLLQKLEYFKLNYKLSSESVRALGEWMPNLKIFKGVVDSNPLPIVCEVWPTLEKLHCLFGSRIMDEDVIGRVNEGSKNGVADLKHLMSFHYNSTCNNSSLSDKSVKEGFLKMKELTDLQICVSKDFSRESEESLSNQIQKVKVYRNYFGNEDHNSWECCRHMHYVDYIASYLRERPSDSDDGSDSDFDVID